MIYFIGEHETEGPVKIGYTTGEPCRASIARRLADLQCANWRELLVVAMMHGDLGDEQRLHRQLGQHRIRREWFQREGEVLALVQAHRCAPISTAPPPAVGKATWPPAFSRPRRTAGMTELEYGRLIIESLASATTE